MYKKQNLHIHTSYVDGKDSPESIIKEALKLGYDSIGFSEHSFIKYSNYPHQLTPKDTELYVEEVRSLKEKYKNDIAVFCGLELDYYSQLDTTVFDYVIGSVHYLECASGIKTFDSGLEATKKYIREGFNGDGMRFAKKYFETLCGFCTGRIDVVGHFDIISKNNSLGNFFDASSREYLSYGFEAIHALKNKVKIFEVNSGAIARGYSSAPYPSKEFLNEFKLCGYLPIITSDCHDKSFLDCHYNESKELLKEAGFSSMAVLTQTGFEEAEI